MCGYPFNPGWICNPFRRDSGIFLFTREGMRNGCEGPGADRGPARDSGGTRRSGWWLGAVVALSLIGCSDSQTASTQPGVGPALLEALSAAADTVEMGAVIDPSIAVRVVAATGDPVEGIPVRFLLESGPGRVFPSLAVSDEEGVAEAFFEADGVADESRVRADIPSASNVEAVGFDVLTVPSAFVQLASEEGNGQVAEIESQLPLPFVVNASVGEGMPVSGIPIAWTVESELGGLRLSADTTFTDDKGRAETLLTFGPETGQVTVAAYATRTTASDTIRFTASARAVLETGVIVDFVDPLPLQAGEQATMFGAGFSAAIEENEVRVEGVIAEIVSASPTEIAFVVPAFLDRCLPEREVGVRALVRGEASNGQLIQLQPAQAPVDLAVGQAVLLRGDEALCVQLSSSSERTDFVFHVQSASRAPDVIASIRMGVRAPEESELGSADFLQAEIEAIDEVGFYGEAFGEAFISSQALAELLDREVRPMRLAEPAVRAAVQPAVEPADLAVGDVLPIRFAVNSDLSVSCESPARVIAGVVRAVGERVIIAEDPQAPAAGFTDADWRLIADEFDLSIYPTGAAYFGEAADLDGNGRVTLVFTPEVNSLTPPGGGRINGFFLLSDLAASGREGGAGVPGEGGATCPASNEGEILYIGVADPDGEFGSPFSKARALRAARRTAAHELQHLLAAEQRVVLGSQDFGSVEESWLDEGLSHLAEELVGLRLMGLPEGQNITFDLIGGDRDRLDVFNIYLIPNFFSLSLYMAAPGIAPVLAPFDPGGLGSEQMRGFGLFFLRWLLDHHGGDDPAGFIRALASGGGGQRQGIANVENETGRAWEDLIAEFAMALAVDDTEVQGLQTRYEITTWNLRDMFAALNENPTAGGRFPLAYPLALAPLGFSTRALDFDLNASTEAYFRLLGQSEAPALAIELFGQDGAALPPTAVAQVLIMRTR